MISASLKTLKSSPIDLNLNFAVIHNQWQKRISKSHTSVNWSKYDFLIRGYRANPLQALFKVSS